MLQFEELWQLLELTKVLSEKVVEEKRELGGPISAGSAVKIFQPCRHSVELHPNFDPGEDLTINQSPFNLDKLMFMGYIYFKCSKDLPPRH